MNPANDQPSTPRESLAKKAVKVTLPLLLVAAGVAIAWLLWATREAPPSETPEPRRPAVRVAAAAREAYRHRVVTHGTVHPKTETTLVAEVTGRVVKLGGQFVAGGAFEKGELLLEIDPTIYRAHLASAEAELARARAALERERAEGAIARDEWEEYGEGEANPLVLREPQLAEAQANLDAAEAALRRARQDLERTTVRAPYRGRVRRRQVDLEHYVTTGTALAVVYGTEHAEVRLPIAPDDVAYLDLPLARPVTDPATAPEVTLYATIGGARHEWPARIIRTEGVIDPETRFVHAVALVTDPYRDTYSDGHPPLLVGTFVEAHIQGREAEDVVVLPRMALQDDGAVYVIGDDATLAVRAVEVVRRTEDEAILAGGLEEGERVVTSDLDVVVDGMTVQVIGTADENGDGNDGNAMRERE